LAQSLWPRISQMVGAFGALGRPWARRAHGPIGPYGPMGPMGPKGPMGSRAKGAQGAQGAHGAHGAGPGARARLRSPRQFWARALARGLPGQPEKLLNLLEGLLHTFEYSTANIIVAAIIVVPWWGPWGTINGSQGGPWRRWAHGGPGGHGAMGSIGAIGPVGPSWTDGGRTKSFNLISVSRAVLFVFLLYVCSLYACCTVDGRN